MKKIKSWIMSVAVAACLTTAVVASPLGCPTPYNFTITNGQCIPTGCTAITEEGAPGGYWEIPSVTTDGGCNFGNPTDLYVCKTQSYFCGVWDTHPGTPFTSACGGEAYTSCTLVYRSGFLLKSGYETTTPCVYCQ